MPIVRCWDSQLSHKWPFLCHSGYNTDICAVYIIHIKLETAVSSILLDLWDNTEMLNEWLKSWHWTTPWKAKCLANAWEAFLIPASSIFTDDSPVLQWQKRDFFWFSCKKAAASRGRNHSPSTPNLKGKGVCICVSLLLSAAVMVLESLSPVFRLPLGCLTQVFKQNGQSSVNYCRQCFVDSESRAL